MGSVLLRNFFLGIALIFLSVGNAQQMSSLEFEDFDGFSNIEENYDTSFEEKILKSNPNDGVALKLVKKADGYFNKMWYAEAARIYDIVLEKSDLEHSLELLSNAADAHYYIGNMEKAFKWYQEIFQNHKNAVTEEKLFKYSHSLKALGRYKRAAELTQLFAKKREKSSLDISIMDNSDFVSIKNMSTNSRYSDFSPMFFGDDKVVYASAIDSSFLTTRRFKWNNQPYLDLYIANVSGEDLLNAKKLSKKVNTKYHEASVAFSPDQKTMYFTRNNYKKKLRRGKKGVNHLKIYKSQLIDAEWSKAVELPFNSENYSNGHPALSPDGKKMYFISDRPGGFGLTDIYEVDILESGRFSEPRNLGESINTPYKEMFPFATDSGLYFSSNRTSGLGGLDVYKSEYTGGSFHPAVNLGKPINSNRDDFSYIIDEVLRKGYFASNRKGGRGDDDIYSFKRVPNLNTITGIVENLETQELLSNVTVALFNEEGEKVKESATDSLGNFVFENLLPTKKYSLLSIKQGFLEEKSEVTTKRNERVFVKQSITPIRDLLVREDETLKINLENIYFDFDKFNIKSESVKELNKLVALMSSNPDMIIRIESHTDSRGSKVYNKYLSDRRAKASRNYIVSQGIDPGRIESAIGYGEERLLNDCGDGVRCARAGHAINRRSEFIIVSM